MTIRAYQESDLPHIQRMWKEIGWATSPEEQAAMEWYVEEADVAVGLINGEAEALAAVHNGTIRYLDTDLDLACVTAVTTSLVGRKQGLATGTTASVVANALERGVHVAALGMFEQGFYDRLGFGTSAYMNQMIFDPSSLTVDAPYRTPSRLSADDWEEIHAAHLRRKRSHGGVAINTPGYTKAELATDTDGAGWGYYEGDRLTHFIWAVKRSIRVRSPSTSCRMKPPNRSSNCWHWCANSGTRSVASRWSNHPKSNSMTCSDTRSGNESRRPSRPMRPAIRPWRGGNFASSI